MQARGGDVDFGVGGDVVRAFSGGDGLGVGRGADHVGDGREEAQGFVLGVLTG